MTRRDFSACVGFAIAASALVGLGSCSKLVGSWDPYAKAEAPLAPTISSATGGSGSVTLAWASFEGATSYNLYYAQGTTAGTGSSCVQVGNALWYTLEGLSTAVQYAFVVTAVGIAGESAASPVVTATTTRIYALRDAGPAGGIIFYDKGSYSNGWRYLEAAPSDQSTGIVWDCYKYITIPTGTEVGTGKANTAAIVAARGSGSYAASLCDSYSLNGYSDWFLPSSDELNAMYTNLASAGLGGFSDNYYWSSSEISLGLVWGFNFSDGAQGYSGKSSLYPARAIREF